MTTDLSAMERWFFRLTEQDRRDVDALRAQVPAGGTPHRVQLPYALVLSMVQAGVFPESVLTTRGDVFPFPTALAVVIDEHRTASEA